MFGGEAKRGGVGAPADANMKPVPAASARQKLFMVLLPMRGTRRVSDCTSIPRLSYAAGCPYSIASSAGLSILVFGFFMQNSSGSNVRDTPNILHNVLTYDDSSPRIYVSGYWDR